MGYTFSFAFKKLGSVEIGGNKSHNLRLHATSSQLKRKEAWITAKGHHTIVVWDDAKIEKARNLAKRKDAVVAIAFSVQLGAQTDWREEPTEEFPEGKPKAWEKKVMNGLHKGAKKWACEEFGVWGAMEPKTNVSVYHRRSVPSSHAFASTLQLHKSASRCISDRS